MESASRNQYQYQPIRTIVGDVPQCIGDLRRDNENLRNYLERLVEAVEHSLEHLTLAQFADGELEKMGGK